VPLVKSLNLLLAILLELVAVIGFSCIGFLIPYPTTLQIIISLLLLVCLILFWGRFMAPKAPKRVGLIAYLHNKKRYLLYCYSIYFSLLRSHACNPFLTSYRS
jgi:hypothetical protein